MYTPFLFQTFALDVPPFKAHPPHSLAISIDTLCLRDLIFEVPVQRMQGRPEGLKSILAVPLQFSDIQVETPGRCHYALLF